VLFDAGLVSTDEPFQRLFNQGMIHATSYQDARGKYYYPEQVEERGDSWFVKGSDTPVATKMEKMSKSRYNVTNPDDMCEQFGADSMRLYELFMGPLEDGAFWEDSGVAGTRRFLDRVWRLVVDPHTGERPGKLVAGSVENKALDKALHGAIKKVTEATASMRFNTAISEMMIFSNEATKADRVGEDQVASFLRVLAPFAPHIAEELWQRLGHNTSITAESWPSFDEAKLVDDMIQLAVQVNGKVRGVLDVAADAGKEQILEAARAMPNVLRHLEGKTTRREIVVPGRLVNFVAN
jgi:leucyl-tRNA synthetase